MNSIKINARRQIELREIYSIIEVYRETYRPDLGKILKLVDENKLELSKGEIENIKRYFYQLGFLTSKGHLTFEGDKLIDTGKMFVAERGIYKLYIIDDPVVGKMVVGYKPISAYDHEENLEELGILENLDDFEGYEDTEFENNLDDKGKFRIKFVRNGDEPPKVAFGEITMHSLYLENNTDGTFRWKLKIDIDKKNIQLNGEIETNVSENMKNWFRNFDEKYKGIRIVFNDVKNPFERERFERKIQITEKIEFNRVEDDNDWSISITVPLIPKTTRDATEWVNYLLLERLKNKNNEYITRYDLDEMFLRIVEKSTIPKVFEDWYFSIDGFIESVLKNDKKEIYYRIKACDDLLLDQSLILAPPTNWKKVMIVVDGSNVAWNHGGRERGDNPLAENIEIMVNSLREKGFKKVVVYSDANLRYLVPDKEKYEELVQKKILRPVPSKIIADYFIIDFAQRYDLFIVTGDKYRDWKEKAEKYGWHSDIKIKNFDIRNGEAIVYDLEVN